MKYVSEWLIVFHLRGTFNKFPDFFVQAFKIVVDSWKFTMLLLYILWDDWPIFMISSSNEQLQHELEYTLLKPDCHSWWISKMQSERYAIKLCFQLGKNAATETYGMLQTAFGASCMNRASVFEWHKRFKECRETVRDDERCGRSKEFRTPKLIGQIKNFMGKDRRVSIETISAQFDVGVGTVHTIIREGTEYAEDLREVCPKGAQRRSERKTLSWQQGDSRADQFSTRSSWCSGDLRWKLDLLLWPRDQETEFQVEACWLSKRVSLWDNWGDERGCDEGHWHAHTRGFPWGLSEVVGTVQVHCSRRILLLRGQEFHVFTIVTANRLKSQNGTLFSHVWRRGRLALDPLQK